MQTKILLPEDRIPKQWYNIIPDMPGQMAPVIHPGTLQPVTAVAVPLWVEAGASPPELWQGDEAPLWAASARLKDLVRPCREGNKRDYLNMTVLDNAAGTGYLPGLLQVEREILDATDAFLAEPRTAVECFQPLYMREIGEGEFGLALVEAMAHCLHLWHRGEATRVVRDDGAWLWQMRG